ncbi:FUSC family protein [Actinomycetaceae bacterium MB13-C1-2]|nr:FUSC family protein [Actinomycetaceae bacterium MB13-C1-2]
MQSAKGTRSSRTHTSLGHRTLREFVPNEFVVSRMIRGTVGALIPLLISLQLDHLKQGLWVFMGVLLLLQGERAAPYAARVRNSLATSTIGMIGFLIGALVPGAGTSVLRDVILVVSMGLVSFCAGYLSGLGPAWASGTLTLLMLASTSMDTDAVATHWNSALWFLVGVALYEVMLLIEWTIFRDLPERRALSASYVALANYAQTVERATADGPESPLSPLPISPTIADPVTAARRRAYQANVDARNNTRTSVWKQEATAIISQIGIETGKVTASRFLPLSLSGVDPASIAASAREDAAQVGNQKLVPSPAERDSKPRSRLQLGKFFDYVSHPSHDSVMRGTRLALCMMTAVVVHRLIDTPHSYWIVVAVAMIAQPDYGSVYASAVQRSIGAIGGVGIGWVIFQFVPKGWWQAAVIILLMAIMPLVKRFGYTAQAIIFTPLMLVFTNLILPGGASVDYGPERLAATAIAAAIVIVMGYAIWPRSRESRIIPLAQNGRLTVSEMLRGQADPSLTQSQLFDLRTTARTAEVALRTQLARSLTEPSAVATQAAMWTPASATLERLIDLTTAASVLPVGVAEQSVFSRAATAAAPVESVEQASRNQFIQQLPTTSAEPEDELLRAIAILASSLDTLTPAPDEVESALRSPQ